MDINLIAGVHLSTATILALFILFMKLETIFLKRLAIAAATLFLAPQVIAFAAVSMGELAVSAIEIITLSQGALSSMAAISYGIMAGVMLNYIKIYLINAFRKMRGQPEPLNPSSES
ncbi:hypothetical protein Ga0123461_1040 [Mariprofundus aestuarium]|uniref:Uncharacterized protein n=1 Tax=Mariprofundus aestuarium TaxID=1921086 RepID=A0A2K8KZV2_MARES|nr:hypothetical protein [Mariprofundus aestuarium]ATX79459.1 hypothetical protein Ga0123461_1040 [Mariprofundus aestuarium]